MNVRVIHKPHAAFREAHDNATPLAGRGGFFAVVSAVHPSDLSVDVITDTGIALLNRKVASFEWVRYAEGEAPSLTGRRDLPPVGSYVYCVMPNGTYDTAFVLCSMFTNEAVHGQYKASDDTDEAVANTVLNVDGSGWQESLDRRTGTLALQNRQSGESVRLDVDQESAGEESITLTVHGTTVTIGTEGIAITTDKAITIDAAGDVTQNYTGSLAISSEGDVSLTAAGSLAIASDGAASLKSTASELVTIGNAVSTLGAMVDTLLTYLQSLTTVGSPATQTISPATVANLKTLQTQWQAVFA